MKVEPHAIPRVVVRDFTSIDPLPGRYELPSDVIHVWRCSVPRDPGAINELVGLLAKDELTRAKRFRFEADRNEFVVTRGTLRTLLASYVCATATDLAFQYSEFGRPTLGGDSPIEFNVSHSSGMLLLAFARNRKIGVDVERIRRDFSTTAIAEQFFSEHERSELDKLPVAHRHEAFFRCWTRKEAFIKALGEGLSHPLHQFDVALQEDANPILLATRPDAREASRWELRNVAVADGFTATVAAELP